MRLLKRSSVCAMALMAGAAAMHFEPAVVRDLVLEDGSRRLAVGAVKVPLWSTALAQSPDSFTLENVSFSWGPFTYEAKRLDFSGVTASRQRLETLFSSSPEPLADRLARISAKQVTAPELKVTQKLGSETQTFLYRNVAMSDIIQGRIGSTMIETTAIEETGAQGSTLTSYGRSTISDLDMSAFASLYETKDDAGSAPLKKIYGAFAIDNIDVVDSAAHYSLQIARLSGRDVMARPTRDSWSGTMAMIAELADKDITSSEEDMRLLHAGADILGAFDAGHIEAADLRFRANPENDKASEVTARIARVAYTGSTGSQPADMRVEGIEVEEPDGRVKIGTISLTGFSITPTLNGLKAIEGKSTKDLDSSMLRSLIPTLGTLRVSGIDVDALSKGETADRPERARFTVDDFEITADKPVNGIPTNIRIAHRNLALELPSNSTDEFVRQLAGLGYKSLDSSLAIAATWDEAAKEIVLKEVSLEAKDVGRLSLTGLLGNVSSELFSSDTATASAALIGVKAKSADLVVEDNGLFERYLAQAAKEQKTKAESLRRMYSLAAPMVLSSMIGNSEQAKELGKAVSGFIAQPGKLTIHAQAKNPSGFGMMDVMLASDPKAALDKLNITAKTE